MTTYECPVPGCNQTATLKLTPVNDGRLSRSDDRLVCPNGHSVAIGTPPHDPRLHG